MLKDSPTRSHLLSHNVKKFISKSNFLHPEKTFTEQLNNAEIHCAETEKSTTTSGEVETGEHLEPRQTVKSDDSTEAKDFETDRDVVKEQARRHVSGEESEAPKEGFTA
jgi:hypothetical protein